MPSTATPTGTPSCVGTCGDVPGTPTPTTSTTPYIFGTFTPTPGDTVVCYQPVVWSFKNEVATFSYPFTAGTLIPGKAYAYFEAVPLRLTWYDGSGASIAESTSSSSSLGFVQADYQVLGTEDASRSWHVVLSDPADTMPATYSAGHADYLDDSPVTVIPNAPTPLATPPCMDMPAVFADKNYSMQQYRFRSGECTVMFYEYRYPSRAAAVVAFYDGGGQLIFTETLDSGNQYRTRYITTGTEAAGTWHMSLYETTSTPPSTYGGGGGDIYCIPNGIAVDVY